MPFEKTQRVVLKAHNSTIGVVIDGPKIRIGQNWYQVVWDGEVKWNREEDLKLYGGEKSVLDFIKSNIYGGIDSFIQKVTLTKIIEPQKNTLYSYNASRTELFGYQYKPLMKYLSSPSKRILIADEVGLGKTIEAAYIFQEERVRHDIDRVLIVCPSQLRIKWQNEMWERFGQKFEILNYSRSYMTLPRYPDNAIYHRLFGIASYNSIRGDKLYEKMEEIPAALDMLIVDEVHHCRNRDTKNFRIIESLAESASAVVFLSATPVHTGNDNLYNLMNLLLPEKFNIQEAFFRQLEINSHVLRAERLILNGSPEAINKAKMEMTCLEYSDISNDPFYGIICSNLNNPKIFTDKQFLVETQEMLAGLNILNEVLSRTRKRDVQEKAPVRNANSVSFHYTEYENEVYQSIISHIYKKYEKHYNDQVARFVLSNISRCVASSLVSTVEKYQNLFVRKEIDKEIDYEIEDEFDEEEVDDTAEPRYSVYEDYEFEQIISNISVERLRNDDTKFHTFLRALNQNKKMIVFAFFKKSLRYLEDRLTQNGIECVRIDGDVPSNPENPSEDERIKRINEFKHNKKCRVMLSSQVGSEGLDFQFCDTVVNWDLPWNPMVVEQRIGRIDRLGQKSDRIHIVNLISKDTVEERILLRLYDRINIFKESIGEIEPILGPKIREISRELLRPSLTEEEKERKIELSAQAIIREKEYMLELEKQSVNLLGLGDLIKEKIDKVQQLGRFITGRQLELYTNHFLLKHCPESVLIDSEGRNADLGFEALRYLKIKSKIKSYLMSKLNPRDDEDRRFMNRLNADILKLAFYPNIANEYPDAELINSKHPLVKCVTEYYKNNAEEIPCTFRLMMDCDFIESGDYFFAWSSIDEKGVQEGRFLKPLFLNLSSSVYIEDEDLAEKLMYNMVVNAEDMNCGHLDADTSDKIFDIVEEYFQQYCVEYASKRKLEAEAIVVRRIQSLKASFDVLRNRKLKSIETAKSKGRSEQVINMFQKHLDQINDDFDIKIADIEAKRNVAVEFKIEGAGLLRIEKS